jgi:hypothetical protein
MGAIRNWLSRFLRRPADQAELERELQIHLELRAAELKETGLTDEEAHRKASRELGNTTRIQESVYEMRPISTLERWSKDLMLAARGLAHNPAFTIVAVLSLALGIGSNAAIFTLADQVLLRVLPVQHPEQLALVQWEGRFIGGSSCGWKESFSLPAYSELRDSQLKGIAGLAALWQETAVISVNSTGERGLIEVVSGNYFGVLGTGAYLGRILNPDDEANADSETFAVLSYAYWTSRFGSEPSVLNRRIAVNGRPVTIVGVADSRFTGFDPLSPPDVFLPLRTPAASYCLGRDRRDSIWAENRRPPRSWRQSLDRAGGSRRGVSERVAKRSGGAPSSARDGCAVSQE